MHFKINTDLPNLIFIAGNFFFLCAGVHQSGWRMDFSHQQEKYLTYAIHAPPCARGVAHVFKMPYNSMRWRAPGRLAHGFQRYTHLPCVTVLHELEDEQKFIYQPSKIHYPCATMRRGGGARIGICITVPCAGARQGGWRMDLRIIHTFHVPPCDRKVAHGC